MSVKAFGMHFHVDDDDDDEDEDQTADRETRDERVRQKLEVLRKNAYKTMPCPDKDQTDLTPIQLERWGNFLQLVAQFKIFASPVKPDNSV